MPELTFTSIESVRDWGVPIILDGTPLSFNQARILAAMVEKYMDEAEHPKDRAVQLAIGTFRSMFEAVKDSWIARKRIPLKGGKVVVRNKYHAADRRDRVASAIREAGAGTWVGLLLEYGARHSKIDKNRIKDAVLGLLSTMNKGDQHGVFKDIRKKFGLRMRMSLDSNSPRDVKVLGGEKNGIDIRTDPVLDKA